MQKLLVFLAIIAIVSMTQGVVYNCFENDWMWLEVSQSYDPIAKKFTYNWYPQINEQKALKLSNWCAVNCLRAGALHPSCTLDFQPNVNTIWWKHCFCWGNGQCEFNPCENPTDTCVLDQDLGRICIPAASP